MLSKIGGFISKLFLFGVSYFAINIVVDVISTFVAVDHTLKPVILFIWTVLPGAYLLKEGFKLYQAAQEEYE